MERDDDSKKSHPDLLPRSENRLGRKLAERLAIVFREAARTCEIALEGSRRHADAGIARCQDFTKAIGE
jgi:hypothetical protein